MLPAMPWSRPRSRYSSVSAVSSRTATRVSHGAALIRICFDTGGLRGAGGRGGFGNVVQPGGELVHAEPRDRLGIEPEERRNHGTRPERALRPDGDVEDQAQRR